MNYIEVRKAIRAINQKLEYISEIGKLLLGNTNSLVNNPEIAEEFIKAIDICFDMLGSNEKEIIEDLRKYTIFLNELLKISTAEGRMAVIEIGNEIAIDLNIKIEGFINRIKRQNEGKIASSEQGMLYEVIKILKSLKCNKILDVNNSLEKGELICKRFDSPYEYLSFDDFEIDSFVNNREEVSIEACENLYGTVLENCNSIVENYDAILVLNEVNTTDSVAKRIEEFKDKGHYIVIKAPEEGDRDIRERYPFKCFQTVHGKIYVLDRQPKEYTGQTALYVVGHKPFEIPKDSKLYFPIHAGKNGKEGFGIPGDDTGDNISNMNPYINELTAVYWIWKNDKEHKYIGINHYRRYFSWKGCFETTELVTEDTVVDLLEKCDVVIVDPLSLYPDTVAETTEKIFEGDLGYIKAYERTREVLGRVHPDDVKHFDKVMNQYKFAACNVFIMKREFFDEYCEWLFGFILDALNEWLKDVKDEKVNNRAIGFMGERMLAVWLKGHHVRVKPLHGFKIL